MTSPTRIRAIEKNGLTEIKILMKHPMETGLRQDAAGITVPAWHITEVSVHCNQHLVLEAQFGPAISKDPFLALRFKGGNKGDPIHINWRDNHNDVRDDETIIL